MNWKKILLIGGVWLPAIFLSGCWDGIELNRIGIVISTGFDYHRDENMYEVTLSAIEPVKGQGGSTQMKEWKASAKSTTVFNAIETLRTRSSNQLTWKHCQTFVFGSGLEEEAFRAIGDWLFSMTEIRASAYVIFAPTRAKTFIESQPELEDVLGEEIYGIIAEQPRTGMAAQATLHDLFISAASPSYTCVAARGEIVHDLHDKPVPVLYGSGVVRDYRFLGWLEPEETIGYYLARGLPNNATFPIDYKGEKVVFETTQNKSRIRPYFKNGQLRIKLEVNMKTRFANTTAGSNKIHSTPHIIRDLQKAQEQEIRRIIRQTLEKSKRLKADILDTGEAVYRFAPDYYRKHIAKWDQIYPQLPIDIQVIVHLREKGQSQKPLSELRGGKV
ncbi:MAG: hypothetical protein BAA01_15890 [Bacillus thermozeamaize]|uniref:Uncharacterized protein n=1 Tax=Bacillus thermozeamaize TaxID=230954 RepID=A0A1Y3PYP0_9BACI|nr:MAG: hypothetical protein BAA01_15890 [Bacillus thermozeamaize]